MWQKTRAFLSRHRKAFLIAFALYVVAIVALVWFSQGPQTEPFRYRID